MLGRTGEYAEAALALNQCIPRMEQCLSQAKLSTAGMDKLLSSLETLYLLQSSADWVAFADVVDFEFIPLWKTEFGQERVVK